MFTLPVLAERLYCRIVMANPNPNHHDYLLINVLFPSLDNEGPAGPKGSKGDSTGGNGAKGVKGQQGQAGPKGFMGDQGILIPGNSMDDLRGPEGGYCLIEIIFFNKHNTFISIFRLTCTKDKVSILVKYKFVILLNKE